MSSHQKFSFNNSDDLLQTAKMLELQLPFEESVSPLFDDYNLNGFNISNRFAIHPMEGFDGEQDGSPSKSVFRRYGRYAAGGSGLIWFEATSVVHEGRSNPRQLLINSGNVDGFKDLVKHTRKSAFNVDGEKHNPFLVLQLTHSGRYSNPEGVPKQRMVSFNPYLDKDEKELNVFDDHELEEIKQKFIDSAYLARDAGFDAVDVKACHGYLLHELLFAHNRKNSRFGGESFENRSRLLLEIIDAVHQKVNGIRLAIRLNFYDGIPSPFGFGTASGESLEIDLTEPFRLIKLLTEKGCHLINGTVGVPRYNAHVGRPFDRPLPGAKSPPEHPLKGVSRLLSVMGQVQKQFPEQAVVGTGFSWLRQFFPNVGAALIKKGKSAFIGLGRSSFAYPDAPRDLFVHGKLDSGKVCITCSCCTELMKNGLNSGCVVRDSKRYKSEYGKIIRERKG